MRLIFVLLLAILPSFAIIIDTAVPGFATGNSAFTGVAAIHFKNANNANSLCSGSLISADLILTAGHCVSGGSNWQVTFGTPTSTATLGVSEAYLHPDYAARPSPLSGIPQYDVAVLRLSSSAPGDATIYGIKQDFTSILPTANPNATMLDLVGFGLYGTAGQTPSLNFSNPVRHWATNSIDFYASTISGVSTPDDPLILTTNFSTAAANEGLVNGGDSGGPLLYGNYIIGVASAGDLPHNSTILTNTTYTNIYASMVDTTTSTWVTSFLVPEPGTFVFAAAGFVALVVRRRFGATRS